jgi:xanthine dehydrogenase small subunit
MRDHLQLFINGQHHRVTGSDVFLSLTDFLRYRLRFVGTKNVCSEGDCGACSVLIGRQSGSTIKYQVVDSCIQFLFQLDGCHIVTVEGLQHNGRLSPVQEAMINCHGSQCGFCTPGFVVSMTGLLEDRSPLSESDLRYGLTGNLCRCIGYSPIIAAGMELNHDESQLIGELYPSESMLAALAPNAISEISVNGNHGSRQRTFYSPVDLPSAVVFLAENPAAKIVAGATDVGVQINKGVISPEIVLDLNRVRELQGV